MMKLQIGELAKLSGVSVRTLHYYDEIGLLKPSELTEAGYRFYDDASLARLQQILFFRELDFPLREIQRILSSPNYDRDRALRRQKDLLRLKKERLERLIGLVDATLKGGNRMSFQEFDNREYETARDRYAQEAKERWGGTGAYEESERKTAQYSGEDWKRIGAESAEIFSAFAARMDSRPEDPEVQALVVRWQEHISGHFYTCTKEILRGLGQMYVADERFRRNIDREKEGLAQFIADAIAVYCGE